MVSSTLAITWYNALERRRKSMQRKKSMNEIIRKLRKERGFTQQQIANYLCVDRSTYAYYESGRTKLNIDVVVKLAHFYQIRYAVLLGPEPVPADN